MLQNKFYTFATTFVKSIFMSKLRLFIVALLIISTSGFVTYFFNQKNAQVSLNPSGISSPTKPVNDNENDKNSTNPSEQPSSKTAAAKPQSTPDTKPPVAAPASNPVASPAPNHAAPVPPPTTGFLANCINVPSACGYPDATNTGVPAGTALTNSGSITVSTNGAIIQNLNISGQIVIRANNVTIKNTRITSGDYYPIDYDGYTGLVIQDTEIYGTNTEVTAGVSFANYTAKRVYIHGTVDGFKADENVLIEDSYVTALRYDAVRDTHNDGVQTTGGNNVTLRHNTFKLGAITGISSVVQIGTEWGPNNNWLVVDNLIDGGGWSINAQAVSAGSNRVFTNNRFTRAHGYGVGDVPNSVWSGNYYDNNGEAIVK